MTDEIFIFAPVSYISEYLPAHLGGTGRSTHCNPFDVLSQYRKPKGVTPHVWPHSLPEHRADLNSEEKIEIAENDF